MNFLLDQIMFILTTIVPVVLGWETGKWVINKIRMPYTWKCPQCNFSIKSSTRDVYEISKSSHNHISSREYK